MPCFHWFSCQQSENALHRRRQCFARVLQIQQLQRRFAPAGTIAPLLEITVSNNTVSYEVADGILTLTLNQPDQLNAFTLEMARELVDAFNRASEDDAVGAIVVTGAVAEHFALAWIYPEKGMFLADESQQPTLEDVAERGEEEHILHGVRDEGGLVTLAIYECKSQSSLPSMVQLWASAPL